MPTKRLEISLSLFISLIYNKGDNQSDFQKIKIFDKHIKLSYFYYKFI